MIATPNVQASERGSGVPGRMARSTVWTRPGWWCLLLGAQALLLGVAIHRQIALFDLSHDFAAYWQAIWWIGAHHRWFPPDSVFGWPALANNAEWVLWPIGFLGYPLWPHPSLLLIVQDGCLVGAEAMAWAWLAEATRDRLPPRTRFAFLGAAMIVLTANPWVLRAALFDFHPESILALAMVGAAWALWRRRGRALGAWTALALACGTLGSLMVTGLAVSALLERQRGAAAWLALAGLGSLAGISLAHLNDGSVLSLTYAYLFAPAHPAHVSALTIILAALRHPGRPFTALWGNASSLALNWLPTGFLGWASLAVVGPAGVLTAVNNLVQPHLGTNFESPGFQNVPVYALLVVGAFLAILRGLQHAHARRRAWAVGGMAAMTILTVGLAAVVMPQEWVPAANPQSRALATIWRRIPPGQEVIASQQVVGRFGNRPWVYAIMRSTRFPLHTRTTNVVIAPGYGAGLLPPADQRAAIRDLRHNPQATFVLHRNQVWWFRVARTPGGLTLPYPQHHLWSIY